MNYQCVRCSLCHAKRIIPSGITMGCCGGRIAFPCELTADDAWEMILRFGKEQRLVERERCATIARAESDVYNIGSNIASKIMDETK